MTASAASNSLGEPSHTMLTVLGHDVHPVAEGESETEVLLDEQDRQIRPLDVVERVTDHAEDDWGESLRRLIHQKQTGVGHERSADRQHLLLSAGQGLREARLALLEARKELEDAFHGPRVLITVVLPFDNREVLDDREGPEDVTTLRNVSDATAGDLERVQTADVLAVQENRAGMALRRVDPGDRADERRLARSVAPEQRQHLAAVYVNRGAVENVSRLVIRVDVSNVEHHSYLRYTSCTC